MAGVTIWQYGMADVAIWLASQYGNMAWLTSQYGWRHNMALHDVEVHAPAKVEEECQYF